MPELSKVRIDDQGELKTPVQMQCAVSISDDKHFLHLNIKSLEDENPVNVDVRLPVDGLMMMFRNHGLL